MKRCELAAFRWINQTATHPALNFFFSKITHLGGASATIAAALALFFFGKGEWRTAGAEAMFGLALSHLPVAIAKKKFSRIRPHLALPWANACENPLTDPSFPSGHTTAAFSVAVPLAHHLPWLAPIALSAAFLVGYSRIYLGLHYPSDCLAGGVLGSAATAAAAACLN